MQIIVVSSDFRSKRTLSVGIPQVIGLGFAGLVALALTATLANYLSLKYAATSNHPLIRGILLADQHAEAKQRQQQIQDNINSLAVKLGEMQAHMLRLDGLGEKLAKVAGLKPQELPSATANAGRGGAATAGAPLSIDDFTKQLGELSKGVDVKADQLSVLEALLVEGSAQRKFLPTLPPIENINYTSNFGYRIDPFNGHQTFHEGVDFAAETGTTINAAASGKVIYADFHPAYGKSVEIDHGNGLVTRYAHGSELLVKEGDLVVRGQRISRVGSTGRSTGPHLHFEVRLNGVPQNPARFLAVR
ncbi:MAG TPA: M23 family metallopeptidase [Casimicrobium huifangae]|uniref:M23 family metallopeptidase n=1 Tax=Casimicrobium huifangae TaxID=2591109 RepID=UPI0012EC4141|nr:M23 family metallopeptidase [Casimicrobium huifangae]HOB00658.1 M23 family metallopeptidase [Casimicrobium huifangae]HQA35641.1 M23 family metallopeptidase [Casimicrobium huifangae]HQD65808.1 M23 family metallopeptidase [Casimicrobium huifangae]